MRPVSADGRSDDALVKATLDGDPEAFDKLWQRHETDIEPQTYRSLCKHNCGRPGEHLPDVMQEGKLRTFRYLHQLRGEFKPWAAKICKRTAGEHAEACRRNKVRAVPLGLWADETPAEAPLVNFPQAMEDYLLLKEVRAEAGRVDKPENFSEIFRMRVDEEMEFEEIAAELERSVVAVKAAYYRGLRELKRRLDLG
jgi:RNA polymerase sigma factor (sigma-70 family)